jgi:ABC-type microcin C transport system permease subunit YejB
MINYIIRRLMLMVPTLLGITLVVFLGLGLAPGGIGESYSITLSPLPP